MHARLDVFAARRWNEQGMGWLSTVCITLSYTQILAIVSFSFFFLPCQNLQFLLLCETNCHEFESSSFASLLKAIDVIDLISRCNH